MSKLVKAILLASLIGASVLPYQCTEAKSSLFQRLKDKAKGRASNEYTEELDKLVKSLESFNKKLKTLVDQTAKLQEDALPEEADFAMLMPLYCWSAISEQFLSEIKVRLQELRDQYASVEGAEGRKDKQESKEKQTVRTGKAIDKEEAKIETAKQKMRQILDHILWDKGIQGMIANIKCSTLILLQVMEANSEPPSTHNSVLKNLISSAERYNDVFVTLREQLESLLGVCLETSDHEEEEGIEERVQQLLSDILIINDALGVINQYYGGKPSNENIKVVDIQSLRVACNLSNGRRNADSKGSQNSSDSRSEQSSAREEPDDEESSKSSSKASKKDKKSKKKKGKNKNKKSKSDQENADLNENSVGNSATDDQSTSKKGKKSKKSKSKKDKKPKSEGNTDSSSKKNKKSKKKNKKSKKKDDASTDTGSAKPITGEPSVVVPISD